MSDWLFLALLLPALLVGGWGLVALGLALIAAVSALAAGLGTWVGVELGEYDLTRRIK